MADTQIYSLPIQEVEAAGERRDTLSRSVGSRGKALLRREPALRELVRLARERVGATQVWLFGSRARGDAHSDSDWDVFLILPDDAAEADLNPGTIWSIGREAGLVADVVAELQSEVAASLGTVNTLSFALAREGVRIG